MANNYHEASQIASDINEHLPTLRDLAKECKHITEMGVRGYVSTWGFVEGLKKGGTLTCIDIEDPIAYGGVTNNVEKACKNKGITFGFNKASTLDIEINETDLLFIDTLHTGEQLKQELELHGDKARKYLVFHDTVSCESELMPVINDFLEQGVWKIKEHYKNNNGVLVLERC